jgi:hypothetical protein
MICAQHRRSAGAPQTGEADTAEAETRLLNEETEMARKRGPRATARSNNDSLLRFVTRGREDEWM